MDLMCNVSTCRKSLTGALWVTRCSHAFCEEHARTLAHKQNVKCPACSTVLGKRFDVIRQNSNPAEDFRAMVLVGLRPEIVLDMAMRATSFWNYQVELELKFQSHSVKRSKEAVEKLKVNHASMLRQLANAKKTSDNHEKQILDLRNTVELLKDQLASKDRQMQKIQHRFNSVMDKAKCMTSQNQTDDYHASQTVGYTQRGHPYSRSQDNTELEFFFEPRILPKRKDSN